MHAHSGSVRHTWMLKPGLLHSYHLQTKESNLITVMMIKLMILNICSVPDTYTGLCNRFNYLTS